MCRSVCIYFHMCRLDDMYGSKRMAYILTRLHRIQASTSTWFSASPFFKMLRSIRPHSSWLVSSFWWTFLACWLQLSTCGFGATHVRRWDSKLRSSPGGVWCVEWARGPVLGRQYTVGIVGRVLLVPYHTKNVDLTTWSNFRSQNMSSVMDFKDELFIFII